MASFKYEPLLLNPESRMIRIIELRPGSFSDDVKVILCHVDLAENPRYEAISYCWGDATIKQTVFCNDQCLDITQSLFTALLRLRDSQQSRYLWADAICIDQTNDDEKSHQVRLMAAIYQNSSRTLIWLGEEDDNSEILKDFIPLLHIACSEKENNGDNRHFMQLSTADLENYGLPPITHQGYIALLKLTGRPWFRRVWIVQEVAVSKDPLLHCGSWDLPYMLFHDVYQYVLMDLALGSLLYFNVDNTDPGSSTLLNWTRHNFNHGIQQPLSELLRRHRLAQATDPRDKVFALCGLATNLGENELSIEVDYRRDMSELYRQTAIAILKHERNLNILSVAGLPRDGQFTGLPSWVPDWRVYESPVDLSMADRAGDLRFDFDATKSSSCNPQFRVADGILGVRGHVIDVVEATGASVNLTLLKSQTVFEKMNDWIDQHVTMFEWGEMCNAHSNLKYRTGEDMLDAYWQTLILGCLDGSFDEKKRQFNFWDSGYKKAWWLKRLPIDYHKWPFKLLFFLKEFSIDNFLGALRGKARDLTFATYLISTVGRSMIKTKQGYIGMATGAVRKNDLVVLLEGGRVPFVLRPKGPFHYLVGDCYVHGVMYGEAFEEDKCQEFWIL